MLKKPLLVRSNNKGDSADKLLQLHVAIFRAKLNLGGDQSTYPASRNEKPLQQRSFKWCAERNAWVMPGY